MSMDGDGRERDGESDVEMLWGREEGMGEFDVENRDDGIDVSAG
jgi:hypothetical protein